MTDNEQQRCDVAVIGAGPAGLMAASVLSRAGLKVSIFDTKPSFGRKFLMAGKSGLNLTKAMATGTFLEQYIQVDDPVRSAVSRFGPGEVVAWCEALGIKTFTGSSRLVFPRQMKASPLLRAWLNELSGSGVQFFPRHHWSGFSKDGNFFKTREERVHVQCRASVFALGGKSWSRLGSDGNWVSAFAQEGIMLQSFNPSNCGFDCGWDDFFSQKFSGLAVKNIRVSVGESSARGDFVITREGIEGGAIYQVSSHICDALRHNRAGVLVDLLPDKSRDELVRALLRPKGRNSLANHLRKTIGLSGVKAGLLRLGAVQLDWTDMRGIADRIKALPLPVTAPRPLDEAISTAGGVAMAALDDNFMAVEKPGVFIAGEMLDWDAPTGGFLITTCLATGKAAGEGVLSWLSKGER